MYHINGKMQSTICGVNVFHWSSPIPSTVISTLRASQGGSSHQTWLQRVPFDTAFRYPVPKKEKDQLLGVTIFRFQRIMGISHKGDPQFIDVTLWL